MTYPLTEGVEFRVTDVRVKVGLILSSGKPVYEGEIIDIHGDTYIFDNRFGSWQAPEMVDEKNRWPGAHPEVAAALERDRQKLEKKNAEKREQLASLGWS